MATMPRECVGVALGAQARRVATDRGSPEGSLLYVSTKRCQKRSKKGVPPILATFWEDFTLLCTPHPRRSSRIAKRPPNFHFMGPFPHFEPKFRGGGSKEGEIVPGSCILEGGGHLAPCSRVGIRSNSAVCCRLGNQSAQNTPK